jgi:DNA-binding SARP family transcriptional activator
MSFLHVSLFGSVRVIRGQGAENIKLTHSTLGLLAYLILYRQRTHQRELLSEIFWGDKDTDRSRGSLNTALWQLRNNLEPSGIPRGTYLINNHFNEIGFNGASPFWLDVAVFDECVEKFTHSQPNLPGAEDLQNLENAVALYRGDLLEGFYDDWALREREHLRMRYLAALTYLMEFYYHKSDIEKSLSYGQKILEMDPLREEIHRQMMKMYLEAGQRTKAARQYEICRDSLFREFHIQPMRETQDLYNLMVLQNVGFSHSPQAELNTSLTQILLQLRNAQAAYEETSQNLGRSIKMLENIIKSRTQEKP